MAVFGTQRSPRSNFIRVQGSRQNEEGCDEAVAAAKNIPDLGFPRFPTLRLTIRRGVQHQNHRPSGLGSGFYPTASTTHRLLATSTGFDDGPKISATETARRHFIEAE